MTKTDSYSGLHFMNLFNIRRSFQQKKERGWKQLYFAIDLHETIIEGKYNLYNEGAKIYPYAREFFKWALNRDDITLILWTSSHKEALDEILPRLQAEGIEFDDINHNPWEKNNSLCDFDKKFYFNVLLDDKAGFEGMTDWKLIINELKEIGEWND